MNVHCAYRFRGDRGCPSPPVDGREITLATGDTIEVLLCENHMKAYDAIRWADKRRADA